jgi:hypothetical protein
MQRLEPALKTISLVVFILLFPASILSGRPVLFAEADTVYANAAAKSNESVGAMTLIDGPTLPTLPTYTATATAIPSSTPTKAFSPTQPPATATSTRIPSPTQPPTATLLPASPTPTIVPYTWTQPPLEICTDLSLPNCKVDVSAKLPTPPAGYAWKRLNGKYTFSAYAHPSEEYYLGDLVDIPGIQGLKAKDGFLFGVDGIGMQGGGYIWRLNAQRQYVPIYITYIKGDWTLGDESVTISDEWRYTESGEPVDTQLISKIRLTNARFAMVDAPKLIPNYSVAAPLRFPSGSKIYVPGLEAFGGTFEVQDCGGAFGPESKRFDLYVGTNINDAVKFIRLNDARSNLPVFILQPIS